jgi:hypothetical protein
MAPGLHGVKAALGSRLRSGSRLELTGHEGVLTDRVRCEIECRLII